MTAAGDQPQVESVTPLELFFDLVFVFTITQLTQVLAEHFEWRSVWHVTVMLALIFWMYDGYAWLTNAVLPRGGRRQSLLLGGMAGFLVLAVSITRAYTGAGLTFGIAYLVINVIHAFLYIRSASEGSAAVMRTIGPQNIVIAIGVLICGAIGGETQELGWTALPLLQWFATRVGETIEIAPAHFVERHGLLVLIAVGESVVAAGIGSRSERIDLALVLSAVLGLLLSSTLWWTYFGAGEEPVERAFTNLTGAARARAALYGFGFAHYFMLLGVVLSAVGIRRAVEHPGGSLAVGVAFALAGGVAIFLLADGWFRRALGLRDIRQRAIGAVAVLAAVPVAAYASAAAGLGVTAVLAITVVAVERGGLGDPTIRASE